MCMRCESCCLRFRKKKRGKNEKKEKRLERQSSYEIMYKNTKEIESEEQGGGERGRKSKRSSADRGR